MLAYFALGSKCDVDSVVESRINDNCGLIGAGQLKLSCTRNLTELLIVTQAFAVKSMQQPHKQLLLVHFMVDCESDRRILEEACLLKHLDLDLISIDEDLDGYLLYTVLHALEHLQTQHMIGDRNTCITSKEALLKQHAMLKAK